MKSILATAATVALASFIATSSHALTAADLSSHPSASDQASFVLSELGKKNAGYHDLVSDVEMTLADADDSQTKRHFRIQVLERPSADDGERSLVQFDSPADVRGTALLSHAQANGDDEQWLFLPSTHRVKRIAMSNRGGAFLGSEFSFEDMTGGDARKYSWSSDGTAPCGSATCVKLNATPKDDSSSYSKRVVFVELGEVRVHHADFYDRRGQLLKTLTYDGYTQLNGKYWRASQWTMQNHQSKRRTLLSFTGMRIGTGLSQADLAPSKLDGR